mgnify:CR=1 FL=1
MNDHLARLFLTEDGGRALAPLLGGTMLSWDSGTYENTVRIGSVDYENLPVVNPSALSTGGVLVALTSAGPIVLGNLHRAA